MCLQNVADKGPFPTILGQLCLIEPLYISKQLKLVLTAMEEDPRSNKELLLAILQKCKDALPEVATLMTRLDKIAMQQSTVKIRKKDCLNPTFLLQLSQCGQQIKNILNRAISEEALAKDSLKYYYKKYMEVIYSIRKYHEQAHLSHDLHKNSTKMKENLLEELKSESIKRKEMERELEFLRKELADRDVRISELESATEDKDSNINISQISQISKKIDVKFGQLYGGESRVGQIQEDEAMIGGKRLRKRLLELQQQLQEKEQYLQQKQVEFQKTIQQQKAQIMELQKKFEEFYSSNPKQLTKASSFKEVKAATSTLGPTRNPLQLDEMYRFLLIQSSTIEEYLKQPQDY